MAVAGSGYISLNSGITKIDVQVPDVGRRRLDVTDVTHIYVGESVTECSNGDLLGDVNNDCTVTASDAHAASLYMASVPDASLLPITSLTTFQRQQMDPNYDFKFGESCQIESYEPPCPNGGSDITYLLRYFVGKYLFIENHKNAFQFMYGELQFRYEFFWQ